MSEPNRQSLAVHYDHRRSFADNVYAYPVVSRRSKGVSLGVNLNPDKVCNFDCVYCQVDRSTPGPTDVVDLERLREELGDLLDQCLDGRLFENERFRNTPEHLRRLNDVAFSGDGEPTSCPVFPEAIRLAAELKRQRGLDSVKLVLITNATLFHRPRVQEGLRELMANNGEIWAKLEAGTEEYYHRIDRTTIPFRRVLDNILLAARQWPVVIQAMFLKMRGQGPSRVECEAFCDRLNEIREGGGAIKGVQVYTVARRPAEDYVTHLDANEVDAIVDLVRDRIGLAVEAFYGPSS